MPSYLAALTFVLLIGIVAARMWLLRRMGVRTMYFGRLDKTDFLIPPIVLFYIYTVFAAAFGWPLLSTRRFFHSDALAWLGAVLCLIGLVLITASMFAFGRSFRVGVDVDHPDRLVTTGIFAFSRNPIYTAFSFILLGQFLIFPNWVPLAALLAGLWLLHRQVLREEAFLRQHYGEEYAAYCRRVRRYL